MWCGPRPRTGRGGPRIWKSAAAIREAVRQRDPQAMAISGDRLGQVCEACHTKYRPQTPTDGMERYPFYPKRDLVR